MMVLGSSWNCSVFSATRTEADSGSVKTRVWNYKFDTTSIVWRAFASYLAVPEFPECLFYRVACPDEYFGSDIAFGMIDSLVNAVQNVKYTSNKWPRTHSGPKALTLRTQNEYIDRLHQFLFPTLFPNINWRLNQALYYSSEVLKNINAHTICFPAAGRTRVQTPRLCQDLWTNFDRSCAANDIQGREVGLLYMHTMKRLRGIQARFPDLSVDLTFLESQEDMQVCRGGLSSSGVRRSDISTIIRARKCARHLNASISCETMFVDDYRYETGILTSDVVHWYRLLKMLRLIGQSYFFIRGIGLVLSCYFVYGSTQPKDNLFTWTRLRNAYYLFIKVPTQCVVYGSSFPVACYVFAHLLDAPFTYQVLESRFYTQSGILYLPIGLFISYVVVQMRNVWIYTLAWHLAMSMISSRWWTRNNPLHNGIVGVPPAFLSTMSGITLFAQYRSTAFRSAKVLHIMQFPSNIGRGWEAVKYQFGFAHRGRGNIWLGAVVIDLKFLICFVIAIAAAWGLRNLLLQIRNDKRHRHWFVLTPTPVPYSAGILWPVTSMSVHWRVSLFCFGSERVHVHRRGNIPKRQPRKSTLGRWSTMMDGRIAPFPLNSTETRQLQVHNRKYNNIPIASTRLSKRRFIQHQMTCLHHRSDEVEATIAFMNVVLLSDPLVFLKIVLGNDESTQLGYYQSVWCPQQIVLLPMAVVGENNEYTSGLKLLLRVNASELTWSELVQCG